GGLFGFIGSFISLNNTLNGIIIILASIIMFIMSLNMLKILNLNIFNIFPNIKIKNKSSFIIGLFNGIMPCGPLQAMQLYALSTSSLILGALSMFFFALGTIPLMLTIGLIINFFSFKRKNFINKISAVLILILSFVMLNRGLLSLGIDISKLTKEDYSSYLKSNIVDGVQYIDFDLTFMGYQDIVIQKGIPVVITIKTNHRSLNGCNNEIKFAQLGFSKQLFEGDNKIEFTINETGKYYYTCWMNMYKNSIIVIDDISFFSNNKGE
ncbi:MAG TPA: heavy metal transporter, partial [Tenericutes bacterium]|nr:heavy metal transporter [Mycoplasmatota bacterium]